MGVATRWQCERAESLERDATNDTGAAIDTGHHHKFAAQYFETIAYVLESGARHTQSHVETPAVIGDLKTKLTVKTRNSDCCSGGVGMLTYVLECLGATEINSCLDVSP